MFLSLAKGQKDLKTLILKEKKKKKKVGILNMGRRFGERLRQPADLTTSSKEGENQEEETREKDPVLKFLTMILTTMMSSILPPRIDTSSWKIA